MNNSIPQKLHHHYQVYGLIIGANIEIPGLHAEKVERNTADIEINMGSFPDDLYNLISQPTTEYYLEPGYEKKDPPNLTVNMLANGRYFHFCYEYGVEFICNRSATAIWGIWKKSLTLEDAALYLLGPIIGFMLRLRGITCLHASGVVVDGEALALTGPSGMGKSTLAASFAAAGYPVLTDDILPLNTVNNVICALSGYSRLRLFPNSFETSQELPDKLPLLAPGWNKHYLDLTSDPYELYKAPATLKVVYIIDRNIKKTESPSIVTLSGAEVVPLLAANTYRNELLNPGMRMKEFYYLSNLASKIRVKKLHPLNDISAMPQLREMLLADFRKESTYQGQVRHYAKSPRDS